MSAIALAQPAAVSVLLDRVAELFAKFAAAESQRELPQEVQLVLIEGVRPIFQAASREEFWSRRDALFNQGFIWEHRMRAFIRACHDLPSHVEPGKSALSVLEQNPPRFLSAEARRYLLAGFRRVEDFARIHPSFIEQVEATGEAPALPQEALADERVGRILASTALLSLWAALLVTGVRPRSDEVADSIAKNFGNVYAGFFAMQGEDVDATYESASGSAVPSFGVVYPRLSTT